MIAISKTFRDHLQRNNSVGTSLPQSPQNSLISKIAIQHIKTSSTSVTMPTAKLYDAVADAGLGLRITPNAISEIFGLSWGSKGAPLIGLTSLLYLFIGAGRARDSYKQMRAYEKIGDVRGANIARAQIAENSFIVGASIALAIVRIFGAVQELFELLKNPIVLSSGMMALKTAAVWISSALYVVFYAIFVGRQAAVLADLSKGDALREKLIKSENPIEELQQHIDQQMFTVFSEEEATELALEEGVKWLEKLEKEVKDFPWEPNLESRQQYAYGLFLEHPEYMMAEMGTPHFFDELTPEGRLVRFGEYIGEKRLCAKIENDLKRQLGPDAMEIFNKEIPDQDAFVKALSSASWNEMGVRWKTVLKIALAVGCAAAVIAGTVFSGGLALGIPLLVMGVSGLIWIAFTDGAAFKSQWESGEIRKRDKFLVGLSIALSVVALGTLIAFTVLSGGAPLYIAGIIFAAGWLLINAKAAHLVVDNQRRPWKYQKEVTVKAFRKFLETNYSQEELQTICGKISLADQNGIGELNVNDDVKKAAEAWEKHLEKLRELSLDLAKERLAEVSDRLQSAQNVVAI